MSTSDEQRCAEIAQFVCLYLDPEQLTSGAPHRLSRRRRALVLPATPEELAKEFLDLSEFQVLRLGTWLSTPEGALLERAVELALTPAYRPQIDLIATALKLAADAQQRQGRRQAAALAAATAVIVGLVSFGGAASS